MSVETVLLESHLKQLGLTTFMRNHAAFAAAAVQSQSTYADYLGALAAQEVNQRAANAPPTRANGGSKRQSCRSSNNWRTLTSRPCPA